MSTFTDMKYLYEFIRTIILSENDYYLITDIILKSDQNRLCFLSERLDLF